MGTGKLKPQRKAYYMIDELNLIVLNPVVADRLAGSLGIKVRYIKRPHTSVVNTQDEPPAA